MKIKIKILTLFTLISLTTIHSQDLHYDPLLDPKVEILGSPERNGSGEYIWYPGQLSAHLQQKRIKESEERCVNVGYPGKFNASVFNTYFRREVNLAADAKMEWSATGNTNVFVNGKRISNGNNTVKLLRGKSILLFEVKTENNIPAIKVSVNNKPIVDEWMGSFDKTIWNFAETSPVFGTNGKTPLDDPEIPVVINPVSILPIRNAKVENDNIVIHKNGYVLIDFFHLEVGKVSFNVKGRGKVTVYVGESPEEALNEDIKLFEQRSIESYTLSETNEQITLPERAVRYVKILCDNTAEVSSVKFTAKVWPVNFLMSFECNDERINNIWKASEASLHASMHGFYLDGLKRDYLPWSMDAVLSTFAADYLFGDKQVSRNSLSVALLPLNPQKPDLGIPDYPLHALLGFNQYYKRYGDFNTILSYRNRIEQLLQFYETLQDDRGFISANVGVSWGFVPGWATRQGPDKKGTPAYAQIMLYLNYKIGADFAKKWGDSNLAKHYQSKAENLKKSVIQYFWDEDQGVFINGYNQKRELDKIISHHAQYWAILAGIFPEDRYDNLFEILPRIPYYKHFVSFEKGYEFIAYSKAGRVNDMWNFLFDVFGDWLEQGHSRFPENFSYRKSKNEQLFFYKRPFGLSLCHGANGVPGVIAVLNGIAGFSQSDINTNQYTIRPDMMDLEWANIEFPVKEGKIKMKLRKDKETEIDIPGGCVINFIDKDGKTTKLSKKGFYSL